MGIETKWRQKLEPLDIPRFEVPSPLAHSQMSKSFHSFWSQNSSLCTLPSQIVVAAPSKTPGPDTQQADTLSAPPNTLKLIKPATQRSTFHREKTVCPPDTLPIMCMYAIHVSTQLASQHKSRSRILSILRLRPSCPLVFKSLPGFSAATNQMKWLRAGPELSTDLSHLCSFLQSISRLSYAYVQHQLRHLYLAHGVVGLALVLQPTE